MSDKPIPVHVYFVLDRSGSMSSLRTDVIGGFNRFVDEQKALPGKCRLSMIQFDSAEPHEILYDAVKIADVGPLAEARFVPRGTTPLLDAEGWMISQAEKRVAERAAAGKKAEAIVFATFTDGIENASREWTNEKLSAKKKACEEAGWAFTYLGVGHDAYGQASSIGTAAFATAANAATPDGVSHSYLNVSTAVSNTRTRAARGRSTSSKDLYGSGELVTDSSASK